MRDTKDGLLSGLGIAWALDLERRDALSFSIVSNHPPSVDMRQLY